MRWLSLACLSLMACDPDMVHDRLNVVEDGAVLPVEVHGNIGSGTLVLFESGGPSGPGIAERDVGYLPFASELEPHMAVALYDRRGTGNATGDYRPDDQSLDQLVDDLAAVRRVLEDRYRPERVVLMGHSFGTFTSALVQLDRRPADAWVAVSPGILRGSDDLYVPWRHAFACRVARDQLDDGATASLWSEIDAFCQEHPTLDPESADWEQARETLWEHLGAIEDRLEPWPGMDPLGLLGAVFASHYNLIDAQLRANRISDHIVAEPGREDLLPELAALDVPTLVITGQYDGTTPTELGQAVTEAVSGPASLVELPGAGHYPMADRPAAFGDAVRALVDDL